MEERIEQNSPKKAVYQFYIQMNSDDLICKPNSFGVTW